MQLRDSLTSTGCQRAEWLARPAAATSSGKIHSLFLRTRPSLPPLYRASRGSFVNQSVSCDGTTRPQLETHIRWVIKNTFPLFASNVNSVLGWEKFPGLKITTVNINVMLPRAFLLLLSVHRVIMAAVIALNLWQITCTGRDSSRPGVVEARPPSSS